VKIEKESTTAALLARIESLEKGMQSAERRLSEQEAEYLRRPSGSVFGQTHSSESLSTAVDKGTEELQQTLEMLQSRVSSLEMCRLEASLGPTGSRTPAHRVALPSTRMARHLTPCTTFLTPRADPRSRCFCISGDVLASVSTAAEQSAANISTLESLLDAAPAAKRGATPPPPTKKSPGSSEPSTAAQAAQASQAAQAALDSLVGCEDRAAEMAERLRALEAAHEELRGAMHAELRALAEERDAMAARVQQGLGRLGAPRPDGFQREAVWSRDDLLAKQREDTMATGGECSSQREGQGGGAHRAEGALERAGSSSLSSEAGAGLAERLKHCELAIKALQRRGREEARAAPGPPSGRGDSGVQTVRDAGGGEREDKIQELQEREDKIQELQEREDKIQELDRHMKPRPPPPSPPARPTARATPHPTASRSGLPPSPRTKRTRLVLPPVLSGHVSSFPPY